MKAALKIHFVSGTTRYIAYYISGLSWQLCSDICHMMDHPHLTAGQPVISLNPILVMWLCSPFMGYTLVIDFISTSELSIEAHLWRFTAISIPQLSSVSMQSFHMLLHAWKFRHLSMTIAASCIITI